MDIKDISDFFGEQKKVISKELEGFLGGEGKMLRDIPWGEDVCERLLKFSLGGKMIRGSLVILAHEVFGGKKKKEAIKAAVAIELLQSGLLVHDDIIDKDSVRRGERTIFAEYGRNLGICIGDIGFFLVYRILPVSLFEVFTKKSIEVGLGQMQDIYLGASKKDFSEKDIMDVYLYKTASYTCSLPLMMGAVLAGENEGVVRKTEELGKNLGVIFQIKDDEMGLFGDEKETGKPVGSDIREGKKTLYYFYLLERASGDQREKLERIFGNPGVTEREISFVRKMVVGLGVEKIILRRLLDFEKRAREGIELLSVSKEHKNLLLALLESSLRRTK